MSSIAIDTGGLFATSLGTGTPLLVMHGGPGLDHTYLRPWLDPLSESCLLAYYDHRGHGRSPRPEDFTQLDFSSWAADADGIREALGEDRIFLFGHSFGAFVALEYALRFGHRLKGLILCGAAPALDYTENALALARSRATDAEFQALLGALGSPAADDEEFRTRWESILPLYFAEPDRWNLDEIHADAVFSADAFNRGMFGCMPSFDVTSHLGEIGTPTLLLTGQHDWITPPDQGLTRLASGLPKATAVIFEESGHFPFIEERESFIEAVKGWLAEKVEV